MFIGRKNELALLENTFQSSKSELAIIYGRRRIGKSSLVKKFAEEKKYFLSFEALEKETTPKQITHFAEQLERQIDDPLLRSMDFKKWENVFYFLTERVLPKKPVRKNSYYFLTNCNGWQQEGTN